MIPELYPEVYAKLRMNNASDTATKGALLISQALGAPIAPDPDDSLAMALHKPKTAALCFDRIWGLDSSIPPEIRFGGLRPGEYEIAISAVVNCWDRLMRRRVLGPTDDPSILDHKRLILNLLHNEELAAPEDVLEERAADAKPRVVTEQARSAARDVPTTGWICDLERLITTSILTSLGNTLGRDVTAVYHSVAARELSHEGGAYEALLGALDALEIVDEDRLTWDGVRDFRCDPEAREKYRRLMLWLESAVAGRSQRQITDEIAVRLDDYRWALKKHGISTLLGHLEAVLDPKSLLPTAGVGGIVALLGQPSWGALCSGLVLMGRVAVKIASYSLSKRDLARTVNPEISFVYEMKKVLG